MKVHCICHQKYHTMSSTNSELSEVTEISEVEEVETEEIANTAESELVEEELLGSDPPNADKTTVHCRLHPKKPQYHSMACNNKNLELAIVPTEPYLSTSLHVGSSSRFQLPEGWIVEERPRRSKPGYVDRYYYEPYTRRKFRSLSSVREHLAREAEDRYVTEDHYITENMISEDTNKDTVYLLQNSTESDEEEEPLEEKPISVIPKWPVKSHGKKKVRGTRRSRDRACKSSSVAQEAQEGMRHSNESAGKRSLELNIKKKETKSEKNNRSPVHNLTEPPPEEVTWVLSGQGGFWNPYVNGLAVSEAEKLRWSEAFVLSLRDKRN